MTLISVPLEGQSLAISIRLTNSKYRKRSKRGSLAEFGPVMFVFLFFALFPMIDLMAVALGAATIALAGRQGASAAASTSDYQTAIDSMYLEVLGMTNSGFGKFVNLKAVSGYKICGANLWVVRTNFTNNQVEYSGPNAPPSGPINQSMFVYEYLTVCTFQVGPLCNLGSVPFIGSVPGLGPPFTIKYCGTAAVEYPDGLAPAPSGPGMPSGQGYSPQGMWGTTSPY